MLLMIWWLNRKTAVSDRLAEQTGNLSGNVFETAGELIDWLKKELADVRAELAKAREDHEECHKAQEALRRELGVLREAFTRQSSRLSESGKHGSEGAA